MKRSRGCDKGNETPEPLIPSRKRLMAATTLTAANKDQPSGRAPPSLILGEIKSKSDHATATRNVNPYETFTQTALGPRNMGISKLFLLFPIKIRGKVTMPFGQCLILRGNWNPNDQKWNALFPTKSPRRNLHFPLMQFLAREIDYPDRTPVRDLIRGMQIAGTVPVTFGLTPRETPDETTYAKWKAETPDRDKATIERVKKSQGAHRKRMLAKIFRGDRSGVDFATVAARGVCRDRRINPPLRNRRTTRTTEKEGAINRRFQSHRDKRPFSNIRYKHPRNDRQIHPFRIVSETL